MAWTPASAQKLWPWLVPLTGPPGHITQRFKGGYSGSGENGIDLGMPTGTPITSLTYGTVLDAGYYGGGGVVSIESTLPSIGVASVYYQHLDTVAKKPGDIVHVGEVIGTSGGQLSGGQHPATCCSGGPHLEVGVNGPFGKQSLWRPLGPNVDPLPWLQNLVQNGPPSADLAGTTLDSLTSSTQTTGFNPFDPISAIAGALGQLVNLLSGTPAKTTGFVRGTGPIADSFTSVEQAVNYAMEGEPWGSPKPDNSGDWGDSQGISNLWGLADIPAFLGVNLVGWGLRLMCFLIALIILTAFIVNLLRPAAEAVGPAAVGMAVGV